MIIIITSSYYHHHYHHNHSSSCSSGEFTRNPNHQVVRWFWELVTGFEQEQKAKLLQFVTG